MAVAADQNRVWFAPASLAGSLSARLASAAGAWPRRIEVALPATGHATSAAGPGWSDAECQTGQILTIIPKNPETSPAIVLVVLRVMTKELQEWSRNDCGHFLGWCI